MQPKKIVIAPDSYKGTLSSGQVSGIIAKAALERFPGCEIAQVPIADGGEGSVDCYLRCMPGEKIKVTVKNPFMEDIEASYGLIGDETAVLEMAACAGLPLAEGRKNPLITTTYGVGQLIADAVKRGARRIILGLGGSATNDAGCGAAAACGAVFTDKNGSSFIPSGGTLKDIDKIDISAVKKAYHGIEFILMCDIDNPMFGPAGAAHIFGPQKGASPDDVALLDNGLRHLSNVFINGLGKDIADIPGAGAAGAMGAGMTAFFGAKLCSGIDTMLETVGFGSILDGADLVITGEGRFDSQSIRGKAVSGVARHAKQKGVPVVVIAGGAEEADGMYAGGITAVFTINRLPEDFAAAVPKSESNLRVTAENIFRLIETMGK